MAAIFTNRCSHSVAEPRQPHLLLAVTDPISLLMLRGQLRTLSEAGFRVTVASGPGEIASTIAEREGVHHVAIAMRRNIAPLADLVALLKAIRVVYRISPDMVNASTPKAGLLFTAAAFVCRVPRRVHLMRGLRFETMSGPSRHIVWAMSALTSSLATQVIAISSSVRNRAVALHLTRADKIAVLGRGSSNGVDLAFFTCDSTNTAAARALRSVHDIPDDALVVGFVGRIAKDKGIGVLARAWPNICARHPNAHLLLAGAHDPADPLTAEECSLLAHHSIHELGHVSDLRAVYAAMDLFVLPTFREGFGTVLLEAAAMKVPTIACRVTGCVDAIEHDVTGTLIPPNDPTAIVVAVSRYLGDEGLRRAHGQAGRKWAQEHFDQEKVWSRLVEFYRNQLDATR